MKHKRLKSSFAGATLMFGFGLAIANGWVDFNASDTKFLAGNFKGIVRLDDGLNRNIASSIGKPTFSFPVAKKELAPPPRVQAIPRQEAAPAPRPEPAPKANVSDNSFSGQEDFQLVSVFNFQRYNEMKQFLTRSGSSDTESSVEIYDGQLDRITIKVPAADKTPRDGSPAGASIITLENIVDADGVAFTYSMDSRDLLEVPEKPLTGLINKERDDENRIVKLTITLPRESPFGGTTFVFRSQASIEQEVEKISGSQTGFFDYNEKEQAEAPSDEIERNQVIQVGPNGRAEEDGYVDDYNREEEYRSDEEYEREEYADEEEREYDEENERARQIQRNGLISRSRGYQRDPGSEEGDEYGYDQEGGYEEETRSGSYNFSRDSE